MNAAEEAENRPWRLGENRPTPAAFRPVDSDSQDLDAIGARIYNGKKVNDLPDPEYYELDAIGYRTYNSGRGKEVTKSVNNLNELDQVAGPPPWAYRDGNSI